MSDTGVGKIKLKRSHNPKKPYERSTSFLGKIKDSVKDLLIPSWLIRSSNEVGDSESGHASTSQPLPQSERQNGPSFFHGNQSVSARQSTSDNKTDSPSYFNDKSGARYSRDTEPAPNVNIATIGQQNVSWHANDSSFSKLTSVFQSESGRRKSEDPARLRMSDSYIGEEQEPPSQLMMSTSVLRKPASNTASSSSQSAWNPESNKLRKALSNPIRDKPSFNSSLLATPKASSDSFGNSSFYSGKTCYGGSAAKRKRTLNTSLPYQSSLPLRKQVTVNKLNSSLNATTSSTAQRILETLDRMSTPLGDAKKIPQDDSTNDSIFSFTPSSYRRASSSGSLRSVTRPLQLPNRKGPPTVQHQTLSQAVLARNRNKVTGVDRRRQEENNSSSLAVSQEISVVREAAQPPQPLVSGGTGKVKSKKFSQHISNRKEDDEEEVAPVPNLPTGFTLPIKSINPITLSTKQVTSSPVKSIPSRESTTVTSQFTFSTPIEQRRPSATNQSLNNSDQGFKFSTPIKASQSNAVGAEGSAKLSPEPAVGASSGVPSYSSPVWGSTAAKPKVKMSSPDIGGTSSSFKPFNKWTSNNTSSAASDESSSPQGFSITPAATLKSGSVMDILGGKTSSPASATVTQNGTDDLMAKFKKPAGSWECDACMLSNKPEAVKCIACEAPKPGAKSSCAVVENDLMAKFRKPAGTWECDACEAPKAGAKNSAPFGGGNQKVSPAEPDDLMAKFMKPSGSWECDACMLQNKPEATKCIACEAPKPGAPASSTPSGAASGSLSEMFKRPAGSWECDVCMVQNASTASRCVACDAPRPGLAAAGTAPLKSNNSGGAVKLAPGGGFVFNAPVSVTSSGGSGFKFGSTAASSEPATTTGSQPAATGFVFTPSSTASSSSSGGFKFGSTPTPSAPSEASTPGGVPSLSNSIGVSKVTFGAPPASTSAAASLFQFGSAPLAPATSKSDSVSPVVEVTGNDKSNSNTNNAVGFTLDNNNKSMPVFGAALGSSSAQLSTSSASSLNNINTTIAQSANKTPPQPQANFNFGAPSSVPQSSALKPSSANSVTPGLFQFGAAPSSTPVNNSGLGMGPSLASGKPVMNGGSTFQPPSDVAKPSGLGNGVPPTVFAFGQNNFSAAAASAQPNQTTKRGLGVEESEPSAKKAFNFGSSDTQTLNGGFHFGAAAQTNVPVFGSAAGASAPTPSGGFVFGGSSAKSVAAQPSGPALGGGFNFGGPPSTANSAGGFNFGQAAAGTKPELKASFNFGSGGQSSSAPFQFGAKPAESAVAPPQFAAPSGITNFSAAPMGMGAAGAFTVGSGTDSGQRKMKRAIRRIPRK